LNSSVTGQMRAAVIDAFGPPDSLHLANLPIPEPGSTEVLVQTHFAGVNPIDTKTRGGHGVPVPRFPAVLGWDLSGVVVRVGAGITRLREGDAVFGMLRFPEIAGAYAEYVLAPEEHIARKPEGVDHREAAAAPMVALTAWQALFENAHLKPDQLVLVHGASGGVGHVAVQLARWKGAQVIGTASVRNHEFVSQLGAQHVVDYATQPLDTAATNVDVVIDTRGGDDFLRLLQLLRPGGTIVSLVGRHTEGERAAHGKGIHPAFIMVRPDNAALAEIGRVLSEGALQITIERVFPLNDAGAAHSLLETGHVRGRLVLEI
jgi:NADPH:quinone reductase-like Zn-dependent oxidoreductase